MFEYSFSVNLFKLNVDFLYPKEASRSHYICFVTTHSRWKTTASCADASHMQQPRLVNSPD